VAQQGILSLSIKDRQSLYQAYMPFVQGGGLFVQSQKRFSLGDEVFLLLTLMDLEERLPIPGKRIRRMARTRAPSLSHISPIC
jgi:type IV pilus assembly protein PilZ